MREQAPSLFFNRGVNKFWYFAHSAKTVFEDMFVPVAKMSDILSIYTDGTPLTIPDDIEGIIILNLPCYAGMNPWGTHREPVSC